MSNVRGERELLAAIDHLVGVVRDVRELPRGWQPNVDIRLDYERRWLDSEGGDNYAPLTPSYAGFKESAVGDLPILQFSTHMYRSLTEEGAPDYVREEEAHTLRVGTSDPKARGHHEGRGRLPVRLVMQATHEEGQAHLRVFHDSYEAVARADGWKVL